MLFAIDFIPKLIDDTDMSNTGLELVQNIIELLKGLKKF